MIEMSFEKSNETRHGLREASALAVAVSTLLHPAQGFAQRVCRPTIAIESASFSEPMNMRRYWTATVDIDSSDCAASSGLFALGFIRLSETAPDLEFAEPFFWRPGKMTVRVEFWWDEALDRYWVADVAACSCRSK
jgi:hypothetical protein